MKLDLRDKLVLQTALLQADVPVAELARQLGMQTHTVRHTLDRLLEAKILLGIRPYLNFWALGVTTYQTFISGRGLTRQARDEFLKALCDSEAVGFVAEVGGQCQYEVHLHVRQAGDILSFEESLAKRFDGKFRIESLSIMQMEEYSGPRYVESGPTVKPLSWQPVKQQAELDGTDHRILSHVANVSFDSKQQAAKRLGMSPSTLFSRLKNLESKGVITGYYYLCDIKALGDMPMALFVGSAAHSAQKRARLLGYCRNHGRIAFTVITTGDWQAKLFLYVQDYEEALEILNDLQAEFPDLVQKLQIMPQLKFHKCTFYPFSARGG